MTGVLQSKQRFRLNPKSGRWISARNGRRRDYLLICAECRTTFIAGACKAVRCWECQRKHEAFLRSGCRGAHRAVFVAIQNGLLKPAFAFQCVDCQLPAVVYDHRDYAKPLEVEPVCKGCNARRGSGTRVFLPVQLGEEAQPRIAARNSRTAAKVTL